ncbi:uncharacterized protein LOC122534365 isoform X2 [Frieseomelitta varia]|uniref:uncharacterized protein LOC122534365 isoform X2 n=1 Tax=Frieseomelitta varia TaxID=561572 RepID=UPI001CB681EE|nr:uncharacterized protein LOC122534365 isoform X2 [Frieseomelitta varia]
MFVKSNSTGKSKDKRLQLTRMTECSTCPKLLPNSTSKKDYGRPQPIKIAQLLKQSESIKNIPQDSDEYISVRKRAQPERLGALSNKKNIKLNDKQSTEMTPSNRCARRFLNFSKISTKITKNDNENENQSNKFEQLHNEVFKPNKKRSLLIPPNTIREKHLQECTQKNIGQSMIHMTLKKVDEINIDSKDENKITDESLNVNINSAVSIESKQKCNDQKIVPSPDHLKSKFTGHSAQHFETLHVTPKISSFSMCKSSQQINNEDQVFMQNNSIREKFTPLKCNIVSKSKETDDCVQNLCNNLQDTVLITSENMEHKSPEMINISKDKIIRFKHDLKDLLTETEENVIKMRSMLTHIVGLFDKEITSNIQLRKGNNTMVDKEVQVETCCKSAQYSEKKVPQVIVTDNVDNKENDGVQSIKKVFDNTADESFLELENQLNITHAKPMQNDSQLKTPKMKKKGKQKRPLREYMALKSNMNFLETPDGKKFRSLCQIDDVDKSVLNVTYISNKLLTDLQNLYSESPDS